MGILVEQHGAFAQSTVWVPQEPSKNPELIFKQNSLGARASSPLLASPAGWKPALPAKKSNS
jgi:hypothetical protein